jgi:hypothetical protein
MLEGAAKIYVTFCFSRNYYVYYAKLQIVLHFYYVSTKAKINYISKSFHKLVVEVRIDPLVQLLQRIKMGPCIRLNADE